VGLKLPGLGMWRLSVSRIVPTHRPLQNYKLTGQQREREREEEKEGESYWERERSGESSTERYRTCSSDDMPNTKAISHSLTNTHTHTHTHTQTHTDMHTKKIYHLSKSQHETVLN